MEPIFKSLAESHPNIKFIHVDIDDAQSEMSAELARIKAVPTFHVYVDGQSIETFAGDDDRRLSEMVDKLDK